MIVFKYLLYLFIGILFILMASLYFQISRKFKRIKKVFNEIVKKYNFTSFNDPKNEVMNYFGSLNILEKGHISDQRVDNFIRGNWNGFDIVLFDYYITTGYFRIFFMNDYTVICVDVNKYDLPEFDIRPKHKILNKYMGSLEYYIKNYPIFSKKFSLRSKHKKSIQSLFTPRVISFFEKKEQPFALKIDGNKFLYIKNNRFLKPENLELFINEAIETLSVLAKES